MYDDFYANFDDLDDVALPGVPNHPQCKTSCSWRVPRLPSSVTVCTHTSTHTSTHTNTHTQAPTCTKEHTHSHTHMYCIPTDIHKNIPTDTHWKVGCPHQYELLWPKPFIARNTVRIFSHKLYPSKHEECLCLWLLAQSHNTLLWALTLDWKNEKAAKCQKTKCVFCSADPFLARPFPLPPPDSLWQVHFSGEIDPSLSLSFTPLQLWLLPLPTQKIHFHFSTNVFFTNFIVFIYLHIYTYFIYYFSGDLDHSPNSLSFTSLQLWLLPLSTPKHHFHISINAFFANFNVFIYLCSTSWVK